MRTTLVLTLGAIVLSGCTISTELDPEGFQAWRKKNRSITGSNLPPRIGDETTVKGMGVEDVEKLQRATPGPRGS